jgi:hypothetical protein
MTDDLTVQQQKDLLAYLFDDWSEEQCAGMAIFLARLRAGNRMLH